MIDLHCHLLPGIDDGAPDLATSLEMARIAIDDGIETIVCTPHIMPGVFDNEPADIRARVAHLARELGERGLALRLAAGSDAHIRPDFVAALRNDRVQPIAGGRYVLFEPPHNVVPPRMEDCLFDIQAAGYVPILTHPERLTWIEEKYDVVASLARSGVLIQLTAGAITGVFGPRPRYWSERMLDEGLVHVVSSDGHNTRRRRPAMREAAEACARLLGAAEADNLVRVRPLGVLSDAPLEKLPELPERSRPKVGLLSGLLRRLRPSAAPAARARRAGR